MTHWLLKTEPSTYAFADLVREQRTTWDGVSNALALIHLRAMKAGDELFIYHTGNEKAVVGTARVAAADPHEGRIVITPGRPLPTPVTRATIKADPAFKAFGLVKNSRLSAMPVGAGEWHRIVTLGG